MKIGFTGTRFGMTTAQRDSFKTWLRAQNVSEFHHGDCVGSDEEAATVADIPTIKVICHPPTDGTHRAFYPNHFEIRSPLSHFARNRNIVNETDALVATPMTCDPITPDTRGGTAYTVNYARKMRKPVAIILPTGMVLEEVPAAAS